MEWYVSISKLPIKCIVWNVCWCSHEKAVLITPISDQRQHLTFHKWLKLKDLLLFTLICTSQLENDQEEGTGRSMQNLLSSKTNIICYDYLLKTIMLLKVTSAEVVLNGYQAFIDFRLFASMYGLVNTSYCATDWRTIPLHGVYKMIS